jgi:4a-hydroxytetrahydrobiopterin dehydratase
MTLADRPMEPLRPDDRPLGHAEVQELLAQIPGWTLAGAAIERKLKFPDFRTAMAFVNRVAEEAETAGHHPDITVSYNRVGLVLSTHKIGGLSRNDFILAARIDRHLDE